MKKREENFVVLKKKADAAHGGALGICEKITAIGTIRLLAKVGDGGKLYGKITNKEIAQEIEKQVGSPVDKRLIKTAGDISALGTYKATIKLAPEATAEINVEVQPEGYVPSEKTEKPLVAASAGAADQAQEDLAKSKSSTKLLRDFTKGDPHRVALFDWSDSEEDVVARNSASLSVSRRRIGASKD